MSSFSPLPSGEGQGVRGRSRSKFVYAFLASQINFIQSFFQMPMHIFIPNANYLMAAFFQPFGPGCIILFLIWLGMRVTVNLDYKFCLSTIKVRYESPDGVLTAYLESEPAISYTRPYFCFGGSKRMAVVACQLKNGRDDLKSRFIVHNRVFALIPGPSLTGRREPPSPGGRWLG